MRTSCAAILIFLLFGHSIAWSQSFTQFDTIFTPPGYPDGDLTATLFIPSVPNGISIVAVHGLGDAVSTMNGWGDTLAANGYTVINIDYPDPVNAGATFPMPVRAVKTAVQFMRRSHDHFHLTTTLVGAVARSLGAGLVAQSMIDEADYSVYGIDNSISDHINFAAILYGIYDYTHFTQTDLPISISAFAEHYFGGDATLEARETPVLQARRITVPLLLIHGTADLRLQYQQSEEFRDSLLANGRSDDLILFSGQPHFFEAANSGLSFTPVGASVKDSVLAFLSYQSAHAEVAPAHTALPSTVQLYPNPVGQSSSSGSTTIAVCFDLQQTAPFSITLQDALGKIVWCATWDVSGEGLRSVEFDVGNLASGIYFCRVQTGSESLLGTIAVEN